MILQKRTKKKLKGYARKLEFSIQPGLSPPISTAVSLFQTIGFLLNRALSSGLTIFSFICCVVSRSRSVPSLALALPAALLLPRTALPLLLPAASAPVAEVTERLFWSSDTSPPPAAGLSVALRCRTVGVGKLCFLSMASTVRWKRRKRACARRSVEGRSILLESSLTVAFTESVKGGERVREVKNSTYHISASHQSASDAS